MPDEGTGGGAADNSKLVAHLERKNRELEADNKKYRDRLKEARDELAKAKPAEGAVVLAPDDAKRWAALTKIEGDPAEIAKKLKRGDEAEVELTALKERETDRAVAEAMQWKPSVWSDQRQLRKLAVELRDQTVEEDGKQVVKKVPHVRPAGDEKAQWQLLSAYAESELADYLPALKADGGESKPNGAAKPAQQWPKQTGTEKPATSSDRAAAFLERKAAASALDKSPLAKAAGLK